ncbi:MAG: hypothetical protein WCD79_11095 [Chthoniobacteraceae bacterium]
MSTIEIFERIAGRFPEVCSKVTELPSGAVVLNITIKGVRYAAEYLPEFQEYGLTNISVVAPFREGFDWAFRSGEELEARVLEMMQD